MSKKTKSSSESLQLAAIKMRERENFNEQLFPTLRLGIKALITLIVVVGAVAVIPEFAGEVTVAAFSVVGPDINLESFSTSMKERGVYWVLIFVLLHLNQRKKSALERNIESSARHITNLESRLDPQRTSSGLTTKGQTPPESQL